MPVDRWMEKKKEKFLLGKTTGMLHFYKMEYHATIK
jgi:hypothetical protein